MASTTINTNVNSLTAQRKPVDVAVVSVHFHATPVFGLAHQQRQGRRCRLGDQRSH